MAQSTALGDACARVSAHFHLARSVKVGVVQSFPELEPPGARLTYSEKMDAEPDQIECQFKTAGGPVELVRFCIDMTCYFAADENAERHRRFEEMQSLMRRDGSDPD